MKISVILAHPDKNSFNHAIAATTVETLKQNGYEVYFHDLYEEEFDPILPTEEIQKVANDIEAASRVILKDERNKE